MVVKRTFVAAEQSQLRAYRLLTDTIAPRMIGWVSSRSGAGVDNLAPYSSFTVVSSAPPMIGFTSFGEKDTLRNITQTGDFTVSVGTRSLVEQLNATASSFPEGQSEYAACGIACEPSEVVSAVRPALAVCTMECRLHSVRTYGDGHFIVGEVLCWVIDADLMDDDHAEGPHPRPDLVQPVAKLGVDEWAPLGDVFRVARPDYGQSPR